jgi:ABC-type branched-subunit amino acid transport system substrate-binding protein
MLKLLISTTLLALPLYLAHSQDAAPAKPIKVGVSTALTGDAAAFGLDIRNALTLMNDLNSSHKYELIFEDEMCDNKAAVAAAKSLIHIHKVRYALGFPCNSTLLATSGLYSSAGVFMVTSTSTGDVSEIGRGIFRLFPSDVGGAEKLFSYLAPRHKKIGILTEQNEYPVMMERSIRLANERAGDPIEFVSDDFIHGDTDLKTTLLRLLNRRVEGIFINVNTDDSFISAVKQIKASHFNGALYAVYLPASSVARQALGKNLNGFIFSNLPLVDNLVTESGKVILKEFRRRYGDPRSGFPVAAVSFEAYRIFDLAINSGKDPSAYLKGRIFSDGYLPSYRFDQYGAVRGINFEIQTIVNDQVVVLNPE